MNPRIAVAVLGVSAALVTAMPAAAHISLEQGGTHLSRYGDASLKEGPCGVAGGTRGTNVYTYEPGTTITISLVETIAHPSYYRIAFDDDGDDGFKEPASIKPIDPKRKCPDGPGDHCGASDFYNAPSVLPGMDNLDPHLSSAALPLYTWTVKLPNVECTNCTLQIIQVMQDDLFHGPYDPTPGVGVEDIYHQCIDLVLKRGAVPSGPDAGGSSGGTSGTAGSSSGTSSDGGTSGAGGAAPGDGGGCSVTPRAAGLSSAASLLAAIALLWSRRRAGRPRRMAR
jgi:uncharacterized membrane protein YgcG